MLGLALLGVTLMLYYVESEEGFRYVYVAAVAMLAVFAVSFVRFNIKHLGKR